MRDFQLDSAAVDCVESTALGAGGSEPVEVLSGGVFSSEELSTVG
jgi:hypothetical protein